MVIFVFDSCNWNTENTKQSQDAIIKEIDSLNQTIYQVSGQDIDSALFLSKKSLQLSRKHNYIKGESEAHIRKGHLFIDRQEYDSALQAFQQSHLLRKKLNDEKLIASSHIHFSALYMALEQFDKAAESINQSLGHYHEINDTVGLYSSYNQLGILYGRQGNFQLSMDAFQKAKKYAELEGDEDDITTSYENLGIAYKVLEQYDSALYFYNLALEHYLSDSSIVDIAGVKASIARLYIKSGRKKEGLDSLQSAYTEAVKLGHFYYQSTALDALRIYYQSEGQKDSAYKYLNLYSKNQKKLYQENLSAEIAKSQVKFRTKQIALENELNKERVRKSNQVKNTLIVLLILFAIFAALLFTNIQQKRKLAEKETELKQQRIDKLLRDHEMKNYEAMVEVQEEERKRIAEDLHDRLGSILSSVKLHFSAIEDKITALQEETSTQYQKATELLDVAAREVRSISHDMISNVLVRFGLIPALHDLQETIESSGKIKMEIFEFGIQGRLDNKVEIAIYRVIQELISNILKHADANRIDIHLNMDENHLNIIVQDDGIGFDKEKIQSKGMGLMNMKRRLQTINGSIEIDSQKNKGTTAVIDINLDHD